MDILFSWVHVSDIHAGHGDAEHGHDQRLVLNVLQQDLAGVLERESIRPDVVLVTGDIAFSGDARVRPEGDAGSEYARARAWLDQVASSAAVSHDKVFLVPGNHDVARSTKGLSLTVVKALRAGTTPLDEALSDSDQRKILEDRFAKYLALCRDLNPACAELEAWNTTLRGREGLQVRLVGLNTALLCNDAEDCGFLRLNREQLHPLNEPARADGEVILVMSHHPLDKGWLHGEPYEQRWVENHANIHLHGHVHDADSWRLHRGGAQKPHLRIAAGAAHEEKKPRGVPYSHGYNIAAIVRGAAGSLELHVWPRRWSAKQAKFVVDSEGVPESQAYAELDLGIFLPGPALTAMGSPAPARRAPEPPRDTALDAAEQEYRDAILKRFRTLPIRMRSVDPVELPLEDVYVDLKVITDIPPAADTFGADERRLRAEIGGAEGLERLEKERQLDDLLYRRWRKPDAARPSPPQSILERIGDVSRPLVILGDPGSGKSTLLHVLAMRAAKSGRLGQNEPGRAAWLPIIVPLASYDEHLAKHDGHLSLEDFLPVYWRIWGGQSDCGAVFQRALREGRALVLLDGLDEVLTPARRFFVGKQVETLLGQWAPAGNRFTLTSRPIGYREAPLSGDIDHVTIVDFSTKDIEVFLAQWCEALERWAARGLPAAAVLERATSQKKALLEELERAPHLRTLAGNPLKLSMLAVLHRQGGRLPTRRVELYREFTTMLLELRPDERSRGSRKDPVERFDVHDVRLHVASAALWLQQHRPSGTASRDDLIRALQQSFLRIDASDPASPTLKEATQAERNAGKLLDELRLVEGLIAARAVDGYGFLHLTYQEFFAAWALVRMKPNERWALLRPNLHQPRWREAILLCAGCLGVLNADTPQVDDLIRRVLGAGSEHDALLHRDALLAAAIVAEDVRPSRPVLDLLYAALDALREVPLAPVQQKALQGLATLAKLGHEASIERLTRLLVEVPSQSTTPAGQEVYPAITAVVHLPTCKPLLDVVLRQIDSRGGRQELLAGMSALWSLQTVIKKDALIRSQVIDLYLDERTDVSLYFDAHHILTFLLGEYPDVLDAFLKQAENPLMQQPAISALVMHAWSNARVRPLLYQWWKETTIPNLRPHLLLAAAHLAKEDSRWFARIVDCLSVGDVNTRPAAISALGQLVADFPEAERSLADCLTSCDASMVQAALGALSPLFRTRAKLRQQALNMLARPEQALRLQAVSSLGGSVVFCSEVRAPLAIRLDDYDEQVRQAALRVLAPVADEEPGLRERFLQRLDDLHTCRKAERIATIAPLVLTDPLLRAQVAGCLSDADPFARAAAIAALAPLLGEDRDLARRVLTKGADPEQMVSLAALRALEPLVRSDAVIREALIKFACSTNEPNALAAVEALAPAVEEPAVRDILLELFDSGSTAVRISASSALAPLSTKDAAIQERFRNLVLRLKEQSSDEQRTALAMLDPVVGHDAIVTLLLNEANASMTPFLDLLNLFARHPEEFAAREEWLALKEHASSAVRRVAIKGLLRWADAEEPIRRTILDAVRDGDIFVRMEAVRVLVSRLVHDEEAQHLLTEVASTDHTFEVLPFHATEQLALHVPWLPAVEQLFRRLLDDDHAAATYSFGFTRRLWAAVGLSALADRDPGLRLELLPWLGARTGPHAEDSRKARRTLAQRLAPLVPEDEALRRQLEGMLASPAWQDRQGAAWTFLAAPGDKSPELLEKLRGLLHDARAEESWSDRLQVAGVFLNHKDAILSRRAVEVAKQALAYRREPWVLPLRTAVHVQAAQVLGTLEPMYADPALVGQLVQALGEETNDQVRTQLYSALLHLTAAEEPSAP